MKDIIDLARKEYPNNGTQQFYRVIAPRLEKILEAAGAIKTEEFDASNGIKGVRQFFQYRNNEYCYWYCIFPECITDQGKKKAYAGIELRDAGKWKLLWTELNVESDNNISAFCLMWKMMVAAGFADNDVIYTLNPFEKAIDNAQYSSDITEQANIMSKIISNHATNKGGHFREEDVILKNHKAKIYIFKVYETMYSYAILFDDENYVNIQLDALYDNNISLNLFSYPVNTDPISPKLLSLILQQKK